ncbi:GDSL-type esterase/lipase family protein [Aquirufa sp.]|jgi:lysophospholipase L1-like esterase|uniref:GDSL-type esterase/lipase family protein n=1 Tax=Aquirufa sp. TaxID=2676249 RepID=UPI0037BF8735
MNKLLIALLLFVSTSLLAQNPFEKEIIAYEKQDSLAMPAKGQILFIGSSSFRLWRTFSVDMRGLPSSINRGFGGSTLADALFYFDRMVVKYQPKWVIMYEGDNDLAKGKNPQVIAAEYDEFKARLAKQVPGAKLVFVAARPSLARTALLEKQRELNGLIKAKGEYFIDMHSPFFLPDGSLMQDIFVADRLHLNEKGYVIFANQIRAFIQKYVK